VKLVSNILLGYINCTGFWC